MKEGGGGGEGSFLPFFPTPSPLTRAIFRAAFAPKQHGNACFAGYCSRKQFYSCKKHPSLIFLFGKLPTRHTQHFVNLLKLAANPA